MVAVREGQENCAFKGVGRQVLTFFGTNWSPATRTALWHTERSLALIAS